MTAVDGCDLRDAESFSRGHNGRIHGAKWKIVVAGNQLGDPQKVRGVNWFDNESGGREISK